MKKLSGVARKDDKNCDAAARKGRADGEGGVIQEGPSPTRARATRVRVQTTKQPP